VTATAPVTPGKSNGRKTPPRHVKSAPVASMSAHTPFSTLSTGDASTNLWTSRHRRRGVPSPAANDSDHSASSFAEALEIGSTNQLRMERNKNDHIESKIVDSSTSPNDSTHHLRAVIPPQDESSAVSPKTLQVSCDIKPFVGA